jgi:predicted nucleic acid-binding protein
MDEVAQGAAAYVDTNIFIYFIEKTPAIFERAAAAFAALADRKARILTNELTVAECLCFPARTGRTELIEVYDRLFGSESDVKLIPLSGSLARRAAMHGGALGLRLADAIHYYSALEAGCSVFLTSDGQFKSGPAIRVIHV